jgi:hypothetical protein
VRVNNYSVSAANRPDRNLRAGQWPAFLLIFTSKLAGIRITFGQKAQFVDKPCKMVDKP